MKHNWASRIDTFKDEKKLVNYFQAYSLGGSYAVIDFITRFCMTYDPRKLDDRVVPFELFPKQEEYIIWLWDKYKNRNDGVVDKCRGIGMSWMNSAFAVYLLIFQKAVTISMYTYKAEECHTKDDIDTLIEKCIFIVKQLPDIFTEGITDKLMRVNNSKNGSIVTGKSGSDPGRGGRSTIFFLDECSKYPHAESIEAAVSQNALCKIWGSTHHGTNTLFYRKCTSGVSDVFTFDWWELGDMYNQEWYDKEKEKAIAEGTLHIFKQEVERDASASLESCLIPSDWVNSGKRCKANLGGKIIAALDPANEGGDLHGYLVVNGNMPIYAQESGLGDPADATDLFFWKAVDMGAEEFRYDSCGIGVGVSIRLKQIIAALKKDPTSERSIKGLKIKIRPWDAGGEVIRKNRRDFADKKNGDFFENAKAQAYWKARTEFLNTYRMVNGKDHDASQLMSFPDNPDRAMTKLIMELSQPQYKTSARGKTMIDKKPDGAKSPNLADAFIICRAEIQVELIPWDVI